MVSAWDNLREEMKSSLLLRSMAMGIFCAMQWFNNNYVEQ